MIISKHDTYFVVLAIILLIVLLIQFTCIKFIKVDHQVTNEFSVTVRGKVVPSTELIGQYNRPLVIQAFPLEYHNMCRGNQLATSPIVWNAQRTEGEYVIQVSVPYPMDIALTTGCNDCEFAIASIRKTSEIIDIDLINWTNDPCDTPEYPNIDASQAAKRAEQLLISNKAEYDKREYDSSELEEVRVARDIANERLIDYSSTIDQNASLSFAYQAIFFAWRAHFELTRADAMHCYRELNQTFYYANHSACLIPPYDIKKNLDNINHNILEYGTQDELHNFSVENIQKATEWVKDYTSSASLLRSQCRENTRLLNASIEYQEPMCEMKKSANYFLAMLALIVGLLFGKIGRRWGDNET